MRKRYMPREVFEVGASAIARMHLASGEPLPKFAHLVWSGYEAQIIDDGVEADLTTAATQGIEWLKAQEAPALVEFFKHFMYFCKHHDDLGRPRRRRLFNGLWFKNPPQDLERVAKYLRKLQVYYAGARAGIMPLASDGWTL